MSRTWLDVLRAEVAAASLSTVSRKLGISRTAISQLCNDKYPGDLVRMQQLVEGVYMGHTVVCPILGNIPSHQCLANQRRSAGEVSNSPMDIKLWKACRSGCPHSQVEDSAKLRQPMRLAVQPIDETQPFYEAQSTIRRLERQSATDAGSTGNQQRNLIELLKAELEAIGVRYNRLVKQSKRQGGNHS
jgi:hypothetical protein